MVECLATDVDGRVMGLFSVKPEQFTPRQISASLAKKCRWNGQSNQFYSVAEHAYIMSLMVPKEHALDALLHELDEVFLPDFPRPLKELIVSRCPEIDEVMKLHMRLGRQFYGLHENMEAIVKQSDNRMMITERNQLFDDPPPHEHWEQYTCKYKPYEDLNLQCLPPWTIENIFMSRLMSLIPPGTEAFERFVK